tara:strand:+ start:77 stop:289 length:213 start_codon:yes stop_codon:yes gene_type:complete
MWRDTAQLDWLPRAVPPACLGHHGQHRGLGSVLRVEGRFRVRARVRARVGVRVRVRVRVGVGVRVRVRVT